MTSIDLIIPSVGRPEVLAQALTAVRQHAAAIHEVIVVMRQGDDETLRIAQKYEATAVFVDRPGLAWAMRTGARASAANVIAFTDDDAEITAGWFDRLHAIYQDAGVGAAGGKDVQDDGGAAFSGRAAAIGQIDRWGRVVGGHHVVSGALRSASHLKGANCSFRRSLFVAYDAQSLVAGQGAQAKNELVATLGIKSQGFDVVLDPALIVLHHPAPRLPGDDRTYSVSKAYEASHNELLAFHLAKHPKRWTNAAMITLVGYRHAPGLLRLALGSAPTLVRATLRGVAAGVVTGRRHRKSVKAK